MIFPYDEVLEIHQQAIAAGLPLMVKSGQSVGSRGVALCRTPGEVIEAFERFGSRGTSVTAQRFYTGPTYLAGALFVHGRQHANLLFSINESIQ